MDTLEIPADVAEALTTARQVEQYARDRSEREITRMRGEALRAAVDTLAGRGWSRSEYIAALINQGWGPSAVGDALGLSRQRIDQLLRQPAEDLKRAELRVAMEKLEKDGLSHTAIAAEFGMSRQRVTKLLRQPA